MNFGIPKWMTRLSSLFAKALLLISALMIGHGAHAEPGADVDPITTLAIGPAFTPAYEGADEYRVVPLVIARARWGARYSVGTGGTGFRADIVGLRFIEAGPALGFRLARTNDAVDDVIARLPEVQAAVELGGFIAFNFPFLLTDNRRDALTIDAEWLSDVSNVHGGQASRVSIRYRGKVSETVVLQTGPYVDFRSDAFVQTYYGVTAADSAASGLDVFNGDGGLSSTGYRFNYRRNLSGRWNITISAAADYKLGDLAESPITADRGARLTSFGGFAIGQSF